MRIVPSLLALALASVASPARADTGVSFDAGYVRSRVAVTDLTTLPGELARFGIRISVGKHLHFGGEAEEGRLAGTTNLPAGSVARGSGTFEPEGPLEGNTLGLKAYIGAHTRLGALMFGADVAGGMRDSWVSSDLAMDVAGRKNEPLLELRSRADVMLTKTVSLGAMISTDVIERRDVAVGAVLSMHFID